MPRRSKSMVMAMAMAMAMAMVVTMGKSGRGGSLYIQTPDRPPKRLLCYITKYFKIFHDISKYFKKQNFLMIPNIS